MDLKQEEIKKIIKDEIKSFIGSALGEEIAKQIKNSSSKTHNELINIIREAMTSVHKFMWMRREVWRNDIK